jgi:flagellar basal body L-ring protein FlgH
MRKGNTMNATRSALVTLLLAAVLVAAGRAQDMRQNSLRSLFSDQKAAHAGDAITIIVVETNSASNDARQPGANA